MDQTVYLGNIAEKGRETRALTVRVIRKWTMRENAGQGDPLYVGMIFADAQVNLAQQITTDMTK